MNGPNEVIAYGLYKSQHDGLPLGALKRLYWVSLAPVVATIVSCDVGYAPKSGIRFVTVVRTAQYNVSAVGIGDYDNADLYAIEQKGLAGF